ncbi:ESPR domain-containing protein [Ralstonia solanacearum]|uniref:ESPR domain-containing protein n=1 Tax=Ralstonia solanacearum TaxID=305 RepID=UPI00399D5F5D
MNAKCYRTVFNAVRGMLVAVEESARSTGKGRQTGGQAGSPVAASASPRRASPCCRWCSERGAPWACPTPCTPRWSRRRVRARRSSRRRTDCSRSTSHVRTEAVFR